jgi:hypothetical protein
MTTSNVEGNKIVIIIIIIVVSNSRNEISSILLLTKGILLNKEKQFSLLSQYIHTPYSDAAAGFDTE